MYRSEHSICAIVYDIRKRQGITLALFLCQKGSRGDAMNKEKYNDPTADMAVGNVMREQRMLKSCKYCGKIHDKKIDCRQKKETLKKYREKKDDIETRFRWTSAWKRKAEMIKKRDLYLCQVCIRELYDTDRRYNTEDLSVHHIIGLRQDYDRRLDDDNLITLCRRHHEMADDGRIAATELRDIVTEQQGQDV